MNKLDMIRKQIEAKKAMMNKGVVNNTSDQLLNTAKKVFVKVSENQIRMYVKLCSQKGVQPDMNYRTWSGHKGGDMDLAIKKLLTMANVVRPSQAQINMVHEVCERCNWEVPEYEHLTGGREGTMSKLINELLELEREFINTQPPTDNQVETILNMYNCPDVDLSDLNESYGMQYIEVQGQTLWARVSEEELVRTIYDVVTYQQASDFIGKYHVTYIKWRETRLTSNQMYRIQRLQTKCGMQPMEEYQLLAFDRQQAENYINNIQLVLRDADLFKMHVLEQDELKKKEFFNQDSEQGLVDTVQKAEENNQNAKEQLLHSLYASMGMLGKDDSDELIDRYVTDDMIRDLVSCAIETVGENGVISMLGFAYEAEEILALFGDLFSDVESSEEVVEDEYTMAENAITTMLEKFLSSEGRLRQAIRSALRNDSDKFYAQALINEELYELVNQALA